MTGPIYPQPDTAWAPKNRWGGHALFSGAVCQEFKEAETAHARIRNSPDDQKVPKSAVHDERSGTPLTTRVSVANITNDRRLACCMSE